MRVGHLTPSQLLSIQIQHKYPSESSQSDEFQDLSSSWLQLCILIDANWINSLFTILNAKSLKIKKSQSFPIVLLAIAHKSQDKGPVDHQTVPQFLPLHPHRPHLNYLPVHLQILRHYRFLLAVHIFMHALHLGKAKVFLLLLVLARLKTAVEINARQFPECQYLFDALANDKWIFIQVVIDLPDISNLLDTVTFCLHVAVAGQTDLAHLLHLEPYPTFIWPMLAINMVFRLGWICVVFQYSAVL